MKPQRVYFPSDYNRIIVGQRGIVSADRNSDYTYFTTEVLSYDSNTGEFETVNTRYVPLAQPDSSVVQ